MQELYYFEGVCSSAGSCPETMTVLSSIAEENWLASWNTLEPVSAKLSVLVVCSSYWIYSWCSCYSFITWFHQVHLVNTSGFFLFSLVPPFVFISCVLCFFLAPTWIAVAWQRRRREEGNMFVEVINLGWSLHLGDMGRFPCIARTCIIVISSQANCISLNCGDSYGTSACWTAY
jgi:hypothetical protein